MSSKYSWTQSIVLALGHYLAYLLEQCQLQALQTAERLLHLFQSHVLAPVHASTNKGRGVRQAKKSQKDEAKLDDLPEISVLKNAIKEAMIDIYVCLEFFKKHEKFPKALAMASLVAMAGVLCLNQHAGRPGEWHMMLKSTIAAVLARGGWYVACADHKTSDVYGVLGKYLAPGTIETLRTFLDLPARGPRLLEPVRETSKDVQLASLLRRFGGVYTPGKQHAIPTLLRKFWTEAVEDEDPDQEKTRRIMARLNAHSLKTQHKHYLVRKALKLAREGRAVSEAVLEGTVPWPAEDIAQVNVEERANALLKRYRRQRKGDADEGDPTCVGGEQILYSMMFFFV
jgi:hypothetical protein